MTFHPSMDYGRGHHVSARALPEEGPAFVFTPEHRATLDGIFEVELHRGTDATQIAKLEVRP